MNLRLYHAPGTRSMRIRWLLEELGLPYDLVASKFQPGPKPYMQATPSGKFPVLVDGNIEIFESGAILQYVLDRYGEGRLMPARDGDLYPLFLQWVHFAEASALTPASTLVWQLLMASEEEKNPAIVAKMREWFLIQLDVLAKGLGEHDYIVGNMFSGADIMLGYTVMLAQRFEVLASADPRLARYLERLATRPAYQRAVS